MPARALTYPLGRPIVATTLVRRLRPLPPGAVPQVAVGEQVRPEQPIAEILAQPGSQSALLAGLAGRVVEIAPGRHIALEGVATLAQGIVGVGGPVVGPLATLPRGESLAVVPIPRGAIVLFPLQAPLTLLQRALAGGAIGVIAASASAREFEAFIRTDVTAELDGLATTNSFPAFTVMLTEGFGNLAMQPQLYQTLSQRVNDTVLLTGTTNPRRNVRAEVLLPQPLGTPTVPMPLDSAIVPGAWVTVASGQLRGARGQVAYLFSRPQSIEQGMLFPCANVRLEDGSSVVVPLHTLDRIG
jgi:hypothetical protein